MAESFDVINAPQYFDFSNSAQDDVDDSFFDKYYEQEHYVDTCNEVNSNDETTIIGTIKDPLNLDELSGNNEFVQEDNCNVENNIKEGIFLHPESSSNSENNERVHEESSFDEDELEDHKLFRRSMSVGDLVYLEMAMKSASLGSETQHQDLHGKRLKVVKEHESDQNINKKSFMSSSKESMKRIGAIPQRSVSKDSLNRLAQPKRCTSNQNLPQPYVTMAEAVQKFQQSTPERFRRKPKLDVNLRSKLATTIPQSPHLVSNQRNRPVHAVSHEEQERMEFEEAQKFKIKANPLNKKILHGPVKPTVPIQKKPNTIPEPFKLTQVPHKVIQSTPTEHLEFHAKAVPNFNKSSSSKTVYQKQLTHPQTPNVLKRYQRSMEMKQRPPEPSQNAQTQPKKSKNTRPLPYSFELRNELLRKKREEFVKREYEKEKKAREFHARPIPKGILQSPKAKNASSTRLSVKKEPKNDENVPKEFKSKPPTVLYKKPFEPKKEEKPLTEIQAFQLNTDQRARERQYFEQLLKEKEEKTALAKQLEEERRIREEQEEIIRIRKLAEYKAQPVKKYKEVIIQPSGKVTDPVSPKFQYKKNSHKDLHSIDKETSK